MFTRNKLSNTQNNLNAFILDSRIQQFFDHCEGDDLQPFNPFHVLKWLGNFTYICISFNKSVALLNCLPTIYLFLFRSGKRTTC